MSGTASRQAHQRANGQHRGHNVEPDAARSGGDVGASYLRFGAMIATAMAAMLALTYVNTYALDHVRWSETRFYMTFVMGAAMAMIMLGFMRSMYTSRTVNVAIVAGSAIVFAFAIWLVRSQATIEDRSYMRAMIPHHSIAVLTSERSNIEDVRVRELAREIITSQEREIAEMEWLIDDIRENGVARTEVEASTRLVPEFGPKTAPRRYKRDS